MLWHALFGTRNGVDGQMDAARRLYMKKRTCRVCGGGDGDLFGRPPSFKNCGGRRRHRQARSHQTRRIRTFVTAIFKKSSTPCNCFFSSCFRHCRGAGRVCRCSSMGEQSNGVPKMDLIEVERSLLSSSTKRRIATLRSFKFDGIYCYYFLYEPSTKKT